MAKARRKKQTLVVVGAHPDDIVFVGGIAAKYAAEGHKVYSLSVTLGETIRKPGPEQEKIKQVRREEGIDIAKILGAEFVYLDVPSNKIIPTMEMKMKLVDAIRALKGNIILTTTPWDVHADHRNLSWTMRDVIYYVGHEGIKADYPPCELRGAYMYDIEMAHNELHTPDFVVDITDYADIKYKAFLSKKRAKAYNIESGRQWAEQCKTWSRFWGLRYGVEYAEPLYQAWGSMTTTDPMRKLKVLDRLPLIGE